ncbi:hypothetical protein OAS14_04295 [Alphaproteobacteria bacterium]|nr:hypothetical protein [Alphaproteobacteria bacterium]
MGGANATTAESKQTDTSTAELQLNYLPDGVDLDDLCYAVIMNDHNYRAILLTASEPYHWDTQRDLKPPDQPK